MRTTTRRRLKSIYFEALAKARVDAILRRLHSRTGPALVLNFHRVSPEKNPYWPPLPPEAFDRLLEHLTGTCEVVSLGQLGRPRHSTLPRVVVSFDDGYRDFVEYAMPILERRGVTANQNVIVRSVESGCPPWVVQVVDALKVASRDRIRALRVPGFDMCLAGADELSKTLYGTRLTGYLKGLPRSRRIELFADIAAMIEETDPRAFTPMMSRDDVVLAAGRHELGSHSYDHEAMINLTDAEFEADFDQCARFFAELGQQINIFAFPYGIHRTSQIEMVRARGVKYVLLVGERPTAGTNGVFHRITMYGDSPAELRLRAAGHRLGAVRGAGE